MSRPWSLKTINTASFWLKRTFDCTESFPSVSVILHAPCVVHMQSMYVFPCMCHLHFVYGSWNNIVSPQTAVIRFSHSTAGCSCKYLYLLFDDTFLANRNYVFSTEGHPLPVLYLWQRWPSPLGLPTVEKVPVLHTSQNLYLTTLCALHVPSLNLLSWRM